MEFSFTDYVNLESTVLLALSRLQTLAKLSKKAKKPAGVACRDVVKFLKANYSWVDGDVESQVMTALLSCVKTGLVCVLNNRRYLLLGSNPSNMISNCMTRITHGSKCCCLSTLEWLYKVPRTCCNVKSNDLLIKKTRKTPKKREKVKSKSMKPAASSMKEPKKISKIATKRSKNCAQIAQQMLGTSKSAISFRKLMVEPKCNYCMEMHHNPKLKRLCTSCFPSGKSNAVPEDKFSPRDELSTIHTKKIYENS